VIHPVADEPIVFPLLDVRNTGKRLAAWNICGSRLRSICRSRTRSENRGGIADKMSGDELGREMGLFHTVARWIHMAGAVLTATAALIFLIRTRFWFPRYIHWMAAIAFAIGLGSLGLVPADAPVNKGDWAPEKRAMIVLFYPAFVYGAFVFYGGQRATYGARFRVPACPHCGQPGGLPGDSCGQCGQLIPLQHESSTTVEGR